jgi:tRNA(Arg) A34 adenosine deaminase TadA
LALFGAGGLLTVCRLAAEPISQGTALVPAPPATPTPAAFIERALWLRQRAIEAGDQPFGAVVVRDSRLVGESASRVIVDGDPTAHAELTAIRDAARRLGTRDLSGCILYSSPPPCPMCEAAAVWANIARLVHGAGLTDLGAPRLTRCGG